MDPILFWNETALEANRTSHTVDPGEQRGPVLGARALAIAHLAMYDAFARVAQNPADLPPYQAALPAPAPGASSEAAVAGAAHEALKSLFPSQVAYFDSRLSAALAPLGGGPGVAAGESFGRAVAQSLIGLRGSDPDAGAVGYTSSPLRGFHRPDPNNPSQNFYAPFFGSGCACFAVTARHELLPPPAIGSPEYVAALRSVRAKGVAPEQLATVTEGRTPEQTLIGLFWAYDGAHGLGTPPRLYNQIIRKLAILRRNSAAQNARLFALVNVAMADAGILAWDQKYIYNLWRPVLGVREQDPSMGPVGTGGANVDADCDPFWLPLGAPASNAGGTKNFTPNFPAYPSGHASFGAAALHIARLFYGVSQRGPDTLLQNLTFVSEELDGKTTDNSGVVRPRHARTFPDGLWQMILENGRSREYLGVHWLFDAFAIDASGAPDLSRNQGGVPLGLMIAEDIYNHGMTLSSVGPRA